jgi:ABC-2 type transport system permease protein
MNLHSSSMAESGLDAEEIRPQLHSATHPFYWSVRRELWENRSIYLAPLIVAAIVLFSVLIGTLGLPKKMRNLPLDRGKRHAAVVSHYSVAPAPIILATFLVGIFYCLDALHSERRDRSILFWKSMPVSDRTTVLSKASVPLLVLPVIGIVLGLVTQFLLLMASTAILLASGVGAATLWSEVRFFQEPFVMIYGLAVHVLWFAPIYAWLLLVSAWARRTPLLWAIMPPFAIALGERMIFSTSYFGNLLRYRFTGAMREAFVADPRNGNHGIIDQFVQLDPARYLSAPGLWVGLIFAAACLLAAIRLRRNREPS